MSRNILSPGVVTPDRIIIGTSDGPRVIVSHVEPRASKLLFLAHFYDLSTVWIAPGNTLSHVDPIVFEDVDESLWDVRYTEAPPSSVSMVKMKQVTAFRRKGTWEEKRTIKIIFPEQSAWEWEEEDPVTMLLAIQDLQKTLGLPLDGHPGSVGRELMKWAIPRDLQQMPHIDLDKIEGVKCARDFAWKIALPEDAVGKWLHAYDKNSQYLSSAKDAGLGVGDPQYYTKENMQAPDIRLAGIWRIEVEPPQNIGYDPKKYPLHRFFYKLPWPLAKNQEWVTTPLLKVLLEMGCQVKVFEGYEWTPTRRLLTKWADHIWGARKHYSQDDTPAGQLCYDSMKRIATASVGLLVSEKTIDRMWYRPDWWSQIIEFAKARIIYNVDKNGREFHIWPSMIYVDCLYYVSDSPEPDKRLLARSSELGGYKHKSCVRITPEMAECFSSDVSAGELVRLINLREMEVEQHAR